VYTFVVNFCFGTDKGVTYSNSGAIQKMSMTHSV